MKKLKYLLPLAALPLLFMQSCSPEEEDLFADSAIERLEADAQSVLDLLCSSENGWEMLYFLNEEADIPCYTLLVKFERSGAGGVAQFASYSDVTQNQYKLSEKSPFEVKIDNSTVLSFDSYNSIFHIFSDPDYRGEKGPMDKDYPYKKGQGMMGDYEFNVVDHSNSDVVMLKGKKRGTYSVLRRLDADVDWQQYFTDLNNVKNTLFTSNPAPIRLVAGDASFHLYNGASSIFQVVDAESDNGTLTAARDWKFVIFSDGLRFITDFEEEGVNAGQDFYYSADGMRMESRDADGNVIATIETCDPYWFFKLVNVAETSGNSAHNWEIQYDGMGAKPKEVFDRIFATAWGEAHRNVTPTLAILARYGDVLGLAGNGLSYSRNYQTLVKTFDPATSTVSYQLGDRQVNMENISEHTNGAMGEFVNYFQNQTYRFETAQPFSLSTLRMVNVADEEISFVVRYN